VTICEFAGDVPVTSRPEMVQGPFAEHMLLVENAA
jgi:hypothetical protein